MTPFKVLYGRDPPTVIRVNRGASPVESLENMLQERDAVLDALQINLIKAQQKMKSSADATRREVHFKVGDRVYLKLQPYRQKSLA